MGCEAGFTNCFDIAQDTLPAVSQPVEIKDGKLLFWLKQKVHNSDFIRAQYWIHA